MTADDLRDMMIKYCARELPAVLDTDRAFLIVGRTRFTPLR